MTIRHLIPVVALGLACPAIAEPIPPAEPLLRTLAEQDWTLSLRLRAVPLGGAAYHHGAAGGGPPELQFGDRATFTFERAAVVFPLLGPTATHRPNDRGVRSALWFGTDVADDVPELLPGYQAGERLARWDAEGVDGADLLRLDVDIPMTTRSVDFDEARALEIGWPEGAWPAIGASALQPQLGIDPLNEDVAAFVLGVLGPKPYAEAPVLAAKRLFGAVVDRFQTNGLGFEYDRQGFFAGIELRLATETAADFRGSPADGVALLVAACRAAGLPARVVIGYDLYAAPERSDESLDDLPDHCGVRFREGDSLSYPRLTYWAELAVFDEVAGTLEWIPMDPLRQRLSSSRTPPLDQPWLFFGNHSCAEALLPISHHFFPPTTVVGAGAPLMWGWMATPEIPLLTQTLQAWGSGTVVTTGE